MPQIKIGALCWNQYADWPELLEAGLRAERLGYDTLWTWDHLYPIVGSSRGPIFEGWLTLTAWAQATQRIRIGLMVGANTFREPTLTAKLATTFDHISGGRAILGIGAAWFREEHRAFGLAYGEGPPDRLRWLREALPIMRGMLRGETPTATGPRYSAKEVRNLPPPVQDHLPILIGGGGEKVTLRLVAEHADMHDIGGSLDEVRRKNRILREHCEAIGRDFESIELTLGAAIVVIRDSREEARRVYASILERNGRAGRQADRAVGTPEDVAAHLAPFVAEGRRHVVADFPSPFDGESMTRFATEVKPLLERG
jgi:alkanesulfonate monooxygenase SsuD/methylene tetrahydromethanopterin reductase-like flavin-dependent oxidoreductase (luciferase family)